MTRKRKLEKAPLVYALIQVRTTEIPNLKDKVDSIHEKMMSVDLIDKQEVKSKNLHLTFNVSDGRQSSNQGETITSYRFYNNDRTVCVVLEPTQIMLKATKYDTFNKIIALFESVLRFCNDSIVSFEKIRLNRIGVRFIDALIPVGNKDVNEYLADNTFNDFAGPITGGANVGLLSERTSYIPTDTGFLRASIGQHHKSTDGRVMLLPSDLAEGGDIALKPIIQDHWRGLGDNRYAILDTDHFQEYPTEENIRLDIDNTLKMINCLRKANSDVFWNILSETAKLDYGYTETEINE